MAAPPPLFPDLTREPYSQEAEDQAALGRLNYLWNTYAQYWSEDIRRTVLAGLKKVKATASNRVQPSSHTLWREKPNWNLGHYVLLSGIYNETTMLRLWPHFASHYPGVILNAYHGLYWSEDASPQASTPAAHPGPPALIPARPRPSKPAAPAAPRSPRSSTPAAPAAPPAPQPLTPAGPASSSTASTTQPPKIPCFSKPALYSPQVPQKRKTTDEESEAGSSSSAIQDQPLLRRLPSEAQSTLLPPGIFSTTHYQPVPPASSPSTQNDQNSQAIADLKRSFEQQLTEKEQENSQAIADLKRSFEQQLREKEQEITQAVADLKRTFEQQLTEKEQGNSRAMAQLNEELQRRLTQAAT
ncbi:hypothetical protein G7046_g7159 [Stylonectria norvegica]|nr:hypothetical protein G7046_g7159 [Stylonectria norvegica]